MYTPGRGRRRRLYWNIDILVHGGAGNRHRDIYNLHNQRMQVQIKYGLQSW